MEYWQIEKLDQALYEIERSLDVRGILLRLQVSSIFDGNDSELVLNDSVYRTEGEKRVKIVEILKTRGSRAYFLFCHYAREKSPQIYQMLHDADNNNIANCVVCSGREIAEFKHCAHCNGKIVV